MRIEKLIVSHASDVIGHASDVIGHASDVIGHASDMTGCDYLLFVALYQADGQLVIFGVGLFLTLLIYVKVKLFGCRVLVRVTRVTAGGVELLLQQLAFK
jgi:hypothetical protein